MVPTAQTWEVTQLDIDGGDGNPVTEATVIFYSDTGVLPGNILAVRSTRNVTDSSSGQLSIRFPAVVLSAGTYWVAVAADEDLTFHGQWLAFERSVVSGSPAGVENPGNGFGCGCTSWQPLSCIGDGSADLIFDLRGHLA